MNVFTAIVPENRSSYGPAFDVNRQRTPFSVKPDFPKAL